MPDTPLLPPDHPDRASLAAEVHARPPEPLSAPSRASYVAVRIDGEARAAEWDHIVALCGLTGAATPAAGATQWATQMGPLRFKWERHGEFSSYTFFSAGVGSQPFADPVAGLLPPGWLAAVPGQTVFAAHAQLVAAELLAADPQADGPASPPSATQLAAHFNHNVVVGAGIGDGSGHGLHRFRHPRRWLCALFAARPRDDRAPGRAHAAAAVRDRGLPHDGAAGAAGGAGPVAAGCRTSNAPWPC